MTAALRSAWLAPRPPDATGPRPRDWALVAVVVAAVLAEGVLRPDVVWRPVAVVIAVVPALLLPWRRLRPFAVFVAAFGIVAAASVAYVASGGDRMMGLTSGIYVLVLVYAVHRWGSGREIAGAIGVLVVVVALGAGRDWTDAAELLLEIAIISIAAVSGVAVRMQAQARRRELDGVRLAEREQLARELHDTVAHHVSAMVVRAQAGRVVAQRDPAAAVEALRIIESEGSRTLAEMRVLVGALRDGEAATLAMRSLSDIASLADAGSLPTVVVELDDAIGEVHPSVGAALFRVAQESVTNARRHASGATQVRVRVRTEGDSVRLTVDDDGAPVPGDRPAGYGIVGMAERASLLGGTLVAGPGPSRGWTVEARVPRTGVAR